MKATRRSTWLVLGMPLSMYSGGSVRAGMIFSDLCARERTIAVRGRRVGDAISALARHPSAIRGPRRLATARMMPISALDAVSKLWRPAVFDVHDHPTLQAVALGHSPARDDIRRAERAYAAHLAAFPTLIAQTESFAELAGLPRDRTFVAPNGTDPSRFRFVPPPDRPAVGFVSGADPGRGIETLVEAVRQARESVPELRLRMALAVTSRASAAYLGKLLERLGSESWVEITSLTYDQVPAYLEDVILTAIPHPPGEYMDAVVPVKLFDAMMSGRPVVATPRIETARVLRTHEAGEVTTGETASDVAASILRIIENPDLAEQLGRNGRSAAMEHYSWPLISRRVTEHLMSIA